MLRRLSSSFSAIKQISELEHLNQYLLHNKCTYVLLYFTAKWNPFCITTHEHIKEISNKFQQFQIIKIDSDVSPKISKHYLVRAEPQFIFCLYGDEIVRQTGPNLQGLIDKSNKMIDLSQQQSYMNKEWIPFGTNFNNFYKNIQWNKKNSNPYNK